jgi:hypothetical protein
MKKRKIKKGNRRDTDKVAVTLDAKWKNVSDKKELELELKT